MPKIVDREAYREQLLSRSFRLFAAHGYEAVSLRMLADELNISTGTLYHYFEGKEDIFVQLVDFMTSQIVEAGLAQVSPIQGREKQLRAVVNFAEDKVEVFGDFINIALDASRMVDDIDLTGTIEGAIKRLHIAIEEVVDEVSRAESIFIFDTLSGVLLRLIITGQPEVHDHNETFWAEVERILLRIL